VVKFNVSVIIVTYSDRWHLLQRVLQAVDRSQGVADVIVVDNGSTYDLSAKVSACGMPRIQVISLGANTGTAYAVKTGLQAAFESDTCDCVWLLDDDNLPEESALDELYRQYQLLTDEVPQDRLALVGLRTDRWAYVKVAHGVKPEDEFPCPNSFQGLHVRKIIRKLLHRMFRTGSGWSDECESAVAIPFGPYGGLFFHKSLLNTIGYPDESFYLYNDDLEFTARIAAAGGRLYLIPGSRIADIDQSWHTSSMERKLTFFSRLEAGSVTQIYYGVRNATVFSRRHLCRNMAIFAMNKFLYLVLVHVYLYLRRNGARRQLIRQAIKDAQQGVMGRNENIGASR